MNLREEAFSKLQKLQNENAELHARLEQLKKQNLPSDEDNINNFQDIKDPRLLEQQYLKERDEIKSIKNELGRLESRKLQLEKNLEKILRQYNENQTIEKNEEAATKQFYEKLIEKCTQLCPAQLDDLQKTIDNYTNTKAQVFNVREEYEKLQRMISFINSQKDDTNYVQVTAKNMPTIQLQQSNGKPQDSVLSQQNQLMGGGQPQLMMPQGRSNIPGGRRGKVGRSSVSLRHSSYYATVESELSFLGK
ncbi:hypothetical protein TVAG_273790 [Trichomonas vaginalis G3]|uniref:Uncharacterized protein n=1 Tax=Trichomonas vaginalis (strain ATCC PRA-98 / G3) TaxID=412133 RepID=A2EI56_TRIV3|nr:hypothetical protein TVAGG3_0521380 [Trichomonas vaginalis G3]EAY07695.1 hypothetical protein TVAG_273790 [Trichomonas vaginalis G3]KAI5518475.1 hypothetical protein TVAGG3_0521380 [Trichomonas vaginalis G3]|eukprot:XP_001319918.1 hypothetical protein [Trichomonas vaginalis G3]